MPHLLAAIGIVALISAAQPTSAPPSRPPAPSTQRPLSVGDSAPELSIDVWVKGARVDRFEPGRIYLLDFWATWCMPCVAAMPHLSELQRTYRDQGLVVIGVAAGERGNYRDQVLGVRALVREKGDQINYTIGIDTNKTMVRPWLEASGRTGLPTAFIIDHTGRIAWAASGAPMLGLEAAIQNAIANARRSAAAPTRP